MSECACQKKDGRGEGDIMKYIKKHYKDCNGKKIWKCIQCDFLHIPISHVYVPHCIKKNEYGYIFRRNEKRKILEDCPLPDY